jgi:hypothetical protein
MLIYLQGKDCLSTTLPRLKQLKPSKTWLKPLQIAIQLLVNRERGEGLRAQQSQPVEEQVVVVGPADFQLANMAAVEEAVKAAVEELVEELVVATVVEAVEEVIVEAVKEDL